MSTKVSSSCKKQYSKSIESVPMQIPNVEKIPLSQTKNEYGLKTNFFDPAKSSPPNEFMLKLYMRNNLYNLVYNNDDNLVIK